MPNLSCKVYRQNKMEKGQGHGFNTGLCLILAAQHRKDPTNWLKVTTNIVGLEPLAWRERFQHQGWFSWARRHPAAFLTLGGVQKEDAPEGERHKLSIKGSHALSGRSPGQHRMSPRLSPWLSLPRGILHSSVCHSVFYYWKTQVAYWNLSQPYGTLLPPFLPHKV